MTYRGLFPIFGCLAISIGGAEAQDQQLMIKLTGFEQVPAILSNGTGTFQANLSASPAFTLTYFNLSSTVTMAHIHFGQRGVNGDVVVWLCGGGGKPACPVTGAVTGTITAADVLAARPKEYARVTSRTCSALC